MSAAQQDFANGVHRGKHVDGTYRRGHGVLGGEQVQVEDGAVAFHQGGLVTQEWNAFDLQKRVI